VHAGVRGASATNKRRPRMNNGPGKENKDGQFPRWLVKSLTKAYRRGHDEMIIGTSSNKQSTWHLY